MGRAGRLPRRRGPRPRFDAFVGHHTALLDKRLLTRFYRSSTLAAPAARTGWVEPDLARSPGRPDDPRHAHRHANGRRHLAESVDSAGSGVGALAVGDEAVGAEHEGLGDLAAELVAVDDRQRVDARRTPSRG